MTDSPSDEESSLHIETADGRRGLKGPTRDHGLRDSWQPGRSYDETWGPYYNLFFPPRRVTSWVYWKRTSTGVNVVRRLWDQREKLRGSYETVHGPDPSRWPLQHPAVVLDAVEWVAHAACLRCQWIDVEGTDMRADGWREEAMARALLHQRSDGHSSSP